MFKRMTVAAWTLLRCGTRSSEFLRSAVRGDGGLTRACVRVGCGRRSVSATQPSRSRCARRPAGPGDSGAGSRAPSRPRRAAPIRGRRRCGCGATRPRARVAIARQIVPPKSMRSAPSSRSISTASAWVAPVSLPRRARDRLGAFARDLAERSRPQTVPQRMTSPRSRATMPRRNTFSAPGRWRDARGDLAAGERLDDRQRAACRSRAPPARRLRASGRPRRG